MMLWSRPILTPRHHHCEGDHQTFKLVRLGTARYTISLVEKSAEADLLREMIGFAPSG